MNMATGDLYGTMDPFQRTSASPRRRGTANDVNNDDLTSGDYQVNIIFILFVFRISLFNIYLLNQRK